MSVAMQPPDGRVHQAYGPAVRVLRVQSLLALSALLLALAVGLRELTGRLPDVLLAKGNGPHPISVIAILIFSAALYRPGLFKAQTPWRRALFAIVFGMALVRLVEIFILPAAWFSEIAMLLYRSPDSADMAMGGNTAVALLLLSLGALIRPVSSTAAFLVTVLGLVPVSYAIFSYAFNYAEGYGAMSPITLVMLTLAGSSQFCVFARTQLLRPLLSASPWGRMARLQLGAATVGILLLGFLFHTRYETGISGALLSSVFWMSVVILLAAGPVFERIERERRALSQEMERQARHDPLTGLLNRRAVRDYVAACQEHEGVLKAGCDHVGIILADVDYFKRVNDSVGHAVGDAVLCEVAEQMRRKLRPSDLVARWGGEEFLILLPGADLARTMSMAQVLRTGVASHVAWDNGEEREAITLSMGVAAYAHGGSAGTLEQAIQRADGALYDAKSQGRNRVLCYDDMVATPEADDSLLPEGFPTRKTMVH
ncbi:GGDEF domain-containing protein [Celeribacter neptunius]|uniref:diguanylate cyclase n=1 Tax=Celeribacter neptunius TaxID=588602 RepID=A0A1I3KBT0_9RHOB|nr:GGDEF domain-containing protein [Celeribacter neptunius]SFI69959.1 diguanylate cyclase (GGDEF) domain-containing protein [Celeribacter neptunius]